MQFVFSLEIANKNENKTVGMNSDDKISCINIAEFILCRSVDRIK